MDASSIRAKVSFHSLVVLDLEVVADAEPHQLAPETQQNGIGGKATSAVDKPGQRLPPELKPK